MKKLSLLVLIVTVAFLFLSMASFANAKANPWMMSQHGGVRGNSPMTNQRMLQDQSGEFRGIMNLDLSAEQITEIREMMLNFQKESLELRNQIQMKQLELKELMLASPIDMTEVRVKLEEIASLQVEVKVKAFENHSKIKEVLTPEQLEKFGLGFPMQGFCMGNYDFNQGFQGFKGNRW